MAITGYFGADFTEFNTAVKAADVELKAFTDDSAKVESQLTRMANTFTGQKIVQEATLMAEAIERVGGVSQLTAAELERVGRTAQEAIAKLKAGGQEVPPEIQKMADSVKEAQGSWGSFVSSLNIETALKNPLGTAKDAFTALAGEMGPTGLAIAGVGAGVVAVGAEIFKLSEDAAAVGANLDSMSQKTGMSVPVLSRMQDVATVAGTSLETLTGTVFKLEQRMGENSKAFQDGLSKIGLSTEQLKAVGVDHYLETVAAGLLAIPDPAERAATGTAILGTSYKNVASVLGDLPRAMELVNDMPVWSPEQAAQAAEFEMQMKSLKLHLGETAMEIGKTFLPAVTAIVERLPGAISATKEWMLSFVGLDNMKEKMNFFSAAWEVMTGKVSEPIKVDTEEAQRKLKELKDAAYDAARTPDALVKAWKDGSGAVKLHVATIDEAFNTAKTAERELNAETAKGAAEQKKFADAMAELDSVGGDWRATLDTLDGAMVEAIKYYLDAGVAQGTLATAYGLTAVQIKAVASAVKEQHETEKLLDDFHKQTEKLDKERHAADLKAMKEKNDAIIAGYQQLQASRAALDAFTNQSSTTTFDAEMQKIQAWKQSQIDGFKGTEQQRAEFNSNIETQALYLQQSLIDKENGVTQNSVAGSDQRAAGHRRSRDAIREEADAVDGLAGAITAINERGPLGGAGGKVRLPGFGSAEDMNAALDDFYDQFRGNSVGTPGAGLASAVFAPGSWGGQSWAGIPRGGAYREPTVTNNFTIVDTADGLARKVSDILTRDVYRGSKVSGY